MKLSDEQVEYIRNRIRRSGIEITSLQDDVLDHLCCEVEKKMEEKVTLDAALTEAIQQLAPEGLAELEQETLVLLNSKIITMKKVMYGIGLVSTSSMSIGLTFKILHMPGGDQLVTYGFLTFALIFLPLVVTSYFKVNIQAGWSDKLRIVLGIVSALATGLSVVFKLFHLQGADILLLSGAAVFSFGFLPFLFFTMYKKSLS
ncbi:hypothetical protein [Ohtaekwangia koreensis]|jgi:hypothetical protein|uniref:Uncharacterized protein n=1 Tax=Ohtaekwangia koreensis TaxID=688867 RepID=A0A1T5JBR8_9BACT|nr:hypothetical protein [Ohtaekwangia koreensis]SKC48698.1 hypothetical protein SAMN05660236_0939 [Ohtaekwangia koreensis]